MSGLACIAGLPSKDFLNNSMFVGRREFGGTATMVIFFVWLDLLKVLQIHINFPRFLPIFPYFLEQLLHLAPIY